MKTKLILLITHIISIILTSILIIVEVYKKDNLTIVELTAILGVLLLLIGIVMYFITEEIQAPEV